MERATAIKRLTKILGKSFGYRVDPNAPSEETRAAARLELKAACKKRDELNDQCEARLKSIVEADAEYQALKVARKEARERVAQLSSISCRYKITVGTSGGLFFTVRAEGDSWEDVIAKLDAK